MILEISSKPEQFGGSGKAIRVSAKENGKREKLRLNLSRMKNPNNFSRTLKPLYPEDNSFVSYVSFVVFNQLK